MSSRTKARLLVLMLTLVGVSLCLRATTHGVGLSRDSVSYLHYARILLRQEPITTEEGIAVPLSHYPPLYPATLAAFGASGVSLITAARVVNVVCFGLIAGLSAALVLRRGGSPRRAAVVSGLVMLQPGVAFIHLWGVSEPGFLVLTVVIAGLMAEYASGRGQGHNRGAWLALATGVAIACASMQRYIGPAFLPAAVWIVWRTRTRPARWRDLAILVAAALLPTFALAGTQRVVMGDVAHRTLQFNALTWPRMLGVPETVREWLADPRVGGVVSWELTGLFLATLLVLVARFGRRSGLGRPVLALTVSYGVLLLLSVMFVDYGTPLDRRLLAPVGLLWTIWIATDVPSPFAADGAELWAGLNGRRLWVSIPQAVRTVLPTLRIPGCVAVVMVLFVGVNEYVVTDHFVEVSRSKGYGFGHTQFRTSELVNACRTLPKGTEIFSNFPEPIWLYAGLDTKILPGHPTAMGREQEPIEQSLASIRKRLRGGGYVAYFYRTPGRGATSIPVSIDEVKAAIPLKFVRRVFDGVLLRSRDSPHANWLAPPPTQPTPASQPATTTRPAAPKHRRHR